MKKKNIPTNWSKPLVKSQKVKYNKDKATDASTHWKVRHTWCEQEADVSCFLSEVAFL
jgi:hypothetical protein